MAFYASRLLVGNELRRLGCNTMRCSGIECRSIATSPLFFFPRSQNIVIKADKDEENLNLSGNKLSSRISPLSVAGLKTEGQSSPDLNMRFKYPEMFPEPFMIWRNPVKEKLERRDMLARRSRIFIPEFYVGSVLRVVLSNVHQHDKTSSFVGICIQRDECGLKAYFILRNVVDNLGVEIKLELYDPRLQKIEVLRLERRLDTHLRYLRDAPPEYSTFPLDMKPEIRRSDEVPMNRMKVKLNPRPWTEWWQKSDYKGIENVDEHITNKMKRIRDKIAKPWEKYDLMKTYRETLPEEEIADILSEIKEDVQDHEQKHKRRLN